jgi:hypothetical protein
MEKIIKVNVNDLQSIQDAKLILANIEVDFNKKVNSELDKMDWMLNKKRVVYGDFSLESDRYQLVFLNLKYNVERFFDASKDQYEFFVKGSLSKYSWNEIKNNGYFNSSK